MNWDQLLQLETSDGFWSLSVCLEAAPLGETQHYCRPARGKTVSRKKDEVCLCPLHSSVRQSWAGPEFQCCLEILHMSISTCTIGESEPWAFKQRGKHLGPKLRIKITRAKMFLSHCRSSLL